MELELKHIAPYLPYGLKFEINIFDQATVNGLMVGINNKEIEFSGIRQTITESFCYDLCIPILRPKTDLNKEIIVNGEKHQMWLLLNGCKVLDNGKIENMNGYLFNILDLKYSQIQRMLEFHIDIFDLIPQGRAIDINTLSANGS